MRNYSIIIATILPTMLMACSVQQGTVGTATSNLFEGQGRQTGIALRIREITGGGGFQFSPDKGSILIKLPGTSTFKEGPALKGASFMARAIGVHAPVKVDIVDVQTHLNRTVNPPTPVPDAFDYFINVNGQPLCAAPLPNAALATPGNVNQPPYVYNVHSPVANFSCDAVVSKCIDWGYKPWRVNGIDWPRPGNAFGQCIFLARADYCAANTTNTEDGTLIDVYDVGLVRPTNTKTPGSTLDLEGIWAPASRGDCEDEDDCDDCDHHAPRLPAVVCLAKKRWDALPWRGDCNVQIQDPRVRGPIIPGCAPLPTTTQFCEEKSFDGWLQSARTTYAQPQLGLLVNDSSYNDIGLYRWDDAATSGSYTTSGYDIWKAGINGTAAPLSASFRYHCFEGKVYQAKELQVRTDLLKLFSYRNAGGEFITTTAATPPTGFIPSTQHLEGYVVMPGSTNLPDKSAGLYLWQDGGHYVTSTSKTARPPSAVLLGYLPRSANNGVPLCDTTLASQLPAADFPSPLTITCPAPTTVECQSGQGCASVPTPPPACGKAAISGPTTTCFPLGTNTTQYTAVDPKGQTASCSSSITVVDTKPPMVVGSPSAGALSPPDHNFRTIHLSDCGIQIQDQCQGALDLAAAHAAITCVTSDESEAEEGDDVCQSGSSDDDVTIVDATTVMLRAERADHGDGRVYHINFSVQDSSGNVGQGSCKVSVPLDAHHPAIDSGVKTTVCRE